MACKYTGEWLTFNAENAKKKKKGNEYNNDA
jgi:hypothetical protein